MNTYEEIKNKIEGKKKTHKILRIIEVFFIILIFVLSFMIYADKDEDGKFFKKYFNIDISFKDFNDKVGLFMSNMLANFNIFIKDEPSIKEVDASIYYQKLGNNYFAYESQEIPMLFYGKILSVEESLNSYNVNVYYKNGINACYYEVINSHVKKGDLLNKGDSLGTYEEKFKAIFAKDNKIISYEEVLLAKD